LSLKELGIKILETKEFQTLRNKLPRPDSLVGSLLIKGSKYEGVDVAWVAELFWEWNEEDREIRVFPGG
jgi:hypothetical protein